MGRCVGNESPHTPYKQVKKGEGRTDRCSPETLSTMLYHGSDDKAIDFAADNPMREQYDLCLTPNRKVAETYGEHVHEVEFDGVADDPEIVVEIADEYGLQDRFSQRIEADSPYFYLLLDDEKVQQALVAEGVTAVRFEDENIHNCTHETIRVFKPGHVTEA